MENERDILGVVTDFYRKSADFNGIAVRQISTQLRLDLDILKEVFTSLIQQDKICVVFDDVFPNPHIKAFDEELSERQIEKLQNTDLLAKACVYPSRSHLKEVINPSDYQGKPF